MSDKNFIQQCFITNEPFYVAKNGAQPRTLLLADPGFQHYRVYFCTQKYARGKPRGCAGFCRRLDPRLG